MSLLFSPTPDWAAFRQIDFSNIELHQVLNSIEHFVFTEFQNIFAQNVYIKILTVHCVKLKMIYLQNRNIIFITLLKIQKTTVYM